MDIPSGRWSSGAIMLVIVPIAVEMVLFQGVWTIVLIPPVTIASVTLNLALFFVLVRPRPWQPRILGMLLGGFAGLFLSGLLLVLEFRPGPPGAMGSYVAQRLESWASSQADPGGGTASSLRFIARHTYEIAAVVLDILGIALIWAGGGLDRFVRRRRAGRRGIRRRSRTSPS